VATRPDATLSELRGWLNEARKVSVSSTRLHGTLVKLDLTLKIWMGNGLLRDGSNPGLVSARDRPRDNRDAVPSAFAAMDWTARHA
jgi:hypothetical protein